MSDEHLMRLWVDSHHGFSADMDRGILELDRFLRGERETRPSIGRAYASQQRAEAELRSTARAALAGVTACLATMALMVTVALLATADVHAAPAHPFLIHAIVA